MPNIDIGYPYYFFGSPDSLDIDVLIDHPGSWENAIQDIQQQHPVTKEWNIGLITINDDRIVKTMPKKGTPDAVHNSLYYTYKHHRGRQVYELPLKAPVTRHLLLAIDGCIKNLLVTVGTSDLKEFYKKNFRKAMRSGIWSDRLDLLLKWPYYELYYEDPSKCIAIYKSLAFDVGQTLSLLDGVELYTKSEVINAHPELADIIGRKSCDLSSTLKPKIEELYQRIKELDIRQIEKHIVGLKTETVNTQFGKLLTY